MVVLAIDHGTVRVGLAVSDALGMLAHPLETVPAALALERVATVVRERGVETVLLGLPLRLNGDEGTAAKRVRTFLARLRPLVPASCLIVLRDEFFTTVEAAERLREAGRPAHRQRAVIDQAAAVVLLQSYLDECNGSAAWPADEFEADDE